MVIEFTKSNCLWNKKRRNIEYNWKQKKNKIESNNRYYSGYFDPSLDEQKAAVFFIKKILNENIPKNLILVTIPRPNDIKKLNEGRNLENLYWYNAFKKLEKDNVKFTFVDLIDYLPKDFSKLFFKCDGHWSPEGNLWAADVLINQNILKKN